MKKIILIVIGLIAFSSFSQELYTFKNGGRITQNGKVISPERVREILVNNQSALNLYEAGRNKKTIGNILLWGGFGVLTGKFYTDATNNNYLGPNQNNAIEEKSRYPYIIGGAMIVLAIPIKIGFSNKIKQAVVLMNQDLKIQKTTYIESTDMIVNSDGIGVSIKF